MQYVIVDSATGQPMYRADGQALVVDLPEGSYAVEWKEWPVKDPVVGFRFDQEPRSPGT